MKLQLAQFGALRLWPTLVTVGLTSIFSIMTQCTPKSSTGQGPSENASLAESTVAKLAPEFTHTGAEQWVNSPPLKLSSLRGKVVLIDVWTFACWNCYRSFPWLNELEARHERSGLQVIGVHTPEFDYERSRQRVVDKAKEFRLRHPIMIDNDYSYWRALDNRYWPTYYLIDKQGRLRQTFIGETHANTNKAHRIEQAIVTLLAE